MRNIAIGSAEPLVGQYQHLRPHQVVLSVDIAAGRFIRTPAARLDITARYVSPRGWLFGFVEAGSRFGGWALAVVPKKNSPPTPRGLKANIKAGPKKQGRSI